MKKLISIGILLITCLTLSSQTTSRKGIMNFVFEGGVQFTGIDDVYLPVSNGGTGYIFGPGIEYYVNDKLKIRGALMFDNRKFSLEGTYTNLYINDSTFTSSNSYGQIVQNYSVNYLTIPLSIIYIKGTNKFRVFIKGTYYLSVYLNNTQTGYDEVYIAPQDANLFIDSYLPEFATPGMHQLDPSKQKLSSSDAGVNMFFGVEYSINEKLALSLAPCFSYSFGNVWNDPKRDVNWSTLYQINLGILYQIK